MTLHLYHVDSANPRPRYTMVNAGSKGEHARYDIIDTKQGSAYIYAGSLRYAPALRILELLNRSEHYGCDEL